METKVQSWGNSLAVRVPRVLAGAALLEEGSPVHLSVRDGELIVRAQRPAFSLRRLLAAVTDENLHGETSTGRARGKEVW